MKAAEAKKLAEKINKNKREKINKRTVDTEQELRNKIIEAVSRGKTFCIPVYVWYFHNADRIIENLKSDGYKVRFQNFQCLYELRCGPYCQYKIWWGDDDHYPAEPKLFETYDAYNFKWEY